ncbi:ribosome-associated translation inhibitor RaiA [Christensenellaceae bacterium OttesenSCG-928-L17]|nr:ribosome-associated translation inhibitor RaiA [Christensenellaceae bacterium OttesenSCG-928-L17]
MLENIEVSSVGKYKITDDFRKYAEKRIGKLEKYLPAKSRKNATARIVVKEVNRPHGNKYEISVALDIPGAPVMSARDEAANVFAGIDIIEAKLATQIRKFKSEKSPTGKKPKKGLFKKIFFKS